MQFVSAIIGPIVQPLMVPVKKQLDYLFFSTKHVRNMCTKMKQLDDTSLDVKKRMDANNISNLEIPARVPGWLEEVKKIKEDAQRISSMRNGCFNVKMRYRAGRNAFKIIGEIKSLIEENKEIVWSDARIPLGRVDSKNISTSGDGENCFKSREKTFNDVLEFLRKDDESQVMMALCGMGGVGKTTMAEQLKKTAHDEKMFNCIVKVVIGQTLDMTRIQQDLAKYTGQSSLPEYPITDRADLLRIGFEKMSEKKEKVLVIFDDVWETIKLKDVGLSPLPNGLKLLLTSRDESICLRIAVEAKLVCRIVNVKVMEEVEAHNFFWQITGVSKQDDPGLNQIGSDIVRSCGFLPLAIKLIATTLAYQEKYAWRDTLHRLKENNLDDNVQEIIEISYAHIKEEDGKAIFRLCGLFPDDSDIPIEELTRYAWSLRLLKGYHTLGQARDRTKTCVQNLKHANLLIDSDYLGCVKMHDLVLSFVVGRVYKGDHEWIVNHGDISNLSRVGINKSCKRISITCKGMSEFPRYFNYPEASLLRLMDGDKSLRFPEDFYERMQNLEVVAYEKMQYPLLPRSLESSTKIRTLLLHQCLLMFDDCSAIGELVNLEVLSLAHCGIRKLPSTIGNLKLLKLLDLTGCVNLRIEDGVLRSLVSLEELYMRASDEGAIRFTDDNRAELAQLLEHLSALEIEFVGNSGKPAENMLFTKLERFRISMGGSLGSFIDLEDHLFENTLRLDTNKEELVESKMNELFDKAEVLFLKVDGMNDLEEVMVKSVHHRCPSFYNLRVLDVFRCENLRYLFTVPMASGLMKLERLTVSKCPAMEVVVENGGDGVIKFQGLKFLYLKDLPKLVGFCNAFNVIELPELVELRLDDLPNFTCINPETTSSSIQPLFNKEVLIPKLEILRIYRMNKLKEIWPYQFINNDKANACVLREIEVRQCDNIVNLFPINPMAIVESKMNELFDKAEVLYLKVDGMNDLEEVIPCPSFYNLERLTVSQCPAMEVVVAYGENGGDGVIKFQGLKFLSLYNLPKLVGFCNTGNVIELPELVELRLVELPNFTCIYPPETTSSSSISPIQPLFSKEVLIPKLEILQIHRMNKLKEIWPYQLINSDKANACVLRYIQVGECDNIVNLFPTNPMALLQHLESLVVSFCGSIEVLFNIDMTSVDEAKEYHPSSLRDIEVCELRKLRELWRMKGDSSSYAVIRSCQVVQSIEIFRCESFENIITPTNAITSSDVKTLMHVSIDGGRRNNQKRDQEINEEGISSIHDITLPLHRLKELGIGTSCQDVEVVFELESWSSSRYLPPQLPDLKVLRLKNMERMSHVWKCNWNNLLIPHAQSKASFHNLTTISLDNCKRIKYLFSPLIIGKLLPNLKKVRIRDCDGIEEVVSNRYDEMATSTSTHTNTMFFPHLENLYLENLPHLKSIDGGNVRGSSSSNTTSVHDEFKCSQVGVASWFLCKYSKNINIRKCDALSTVLPYYVVGQPHKLEELTIFECKSMVEVFETAITIPRSTNMTLHELHNLTRLEVIDCELLKHVFSSSMLESLERLKELTVKNCKKMQVIVQLEDGEQIDTSKTIVFPCLKSITLANLLNLGGFFLGMNEFRWPSLENVEMYGCPQMTSFTSGHSDAPKLKYIHTGLCKHSLESGLNFHLSNTDATQKDLIPIGINLRQFPWSFSNLVEVDEQVDKQVDGLHGFSSNLLKRSVLLPCEELFNLKNLERISISDGYGQSEIQEVFEVVEGRNDDENVVEFPKLKEVALDGISTLQHMWKSNRWVLKFPNLTKVSISVCRSLQHVFTGSMVGSLEKLQELQISNCWKMDVIVEDSETEVVNVFPCLKSITLHYLTSLKGFCLGKADYEWPLLDTLEIKDCPSIKVFTNGKSTTPNLKVIDTTFGLCLATEDPNSFIKTKLQEVI